MDHAIRGVDHLRGKRVLTLESSTSAACPEDELIRYRSAPDLDDALGDLDAGRADAVVYDAPMLRYRVNEHHASSLRVLPTVLARQEYGIGLGKRCFIALPVRAKDGPLFSRALSP